MKHQHVEASRQATAGYQNRVAHVASETEV